jgi:hypothetical protein
MFPIKTSNPPKPYGSKSSDVVDGCPHQLLEYVGTHFAPQVVKELSERKYSYSFMDTTQECNTLGKYEKLILELRW